MKTKHKNSLILLVLPILFFALHYFVYLGHYQSPFDGNESLPDWFVLASDAPQPLNIKKITLTKSIYPDYLHPFRPLEYHYSEKSGGETVIVEKGSMFSSDMETVMGDPAEYFNEKVDGPFYRGFGVEGHPNMLFFLIQYLIIGVFVFLIVKSKTIFTSN